MGQDDKERSAIVMPLANQMEEWWGSVMDVGLGPELSKVVRALGSGYCPNRKGI